MQRGHCLGEVYICSCHKVCERCQDSYTFTERVIFLARFITHHTSGELSHKMHVRTSGAVAPWLLPGQSSKQNYTIEHGGNPTHSLLHACMWYGVPVVQPLASSKTRVQESKLKYVECSFYSIIPNIS